MIGNHTQGLGIVRSAAAAGARVWVVNDTALGLSRFSRYLSGYKRVPRGTLRDLSGPEPATALLDALLTLPLEHRSALLGVNEDITEFIYRHEKRLREKYFVPRGLDNVYDKYVFNTLLPETSRIETSLCSEVDVAGFDQPRRYVLKGRQGNAFRRVTGKKAIRLDTLTERARNRLFSEIPTDQVILQEIVETDDPVVSICSFSVDGERTGVFAYEKLRQHPDRFGTGTYLRSIRATSLEPLADEILRTLQFTGISEIEFIKDRRNGRPKVVEMNPRTWKSVHFATQCGENLVARLLAYVTTGEKTTQGDYISGRYWADLATDIPQMLRSMRMARYERDFFECTWDRSDPWPAVALWTLFPVIALEERLPASLLRRRRVRAATS